MTIASATDLVQLLRSHQLLEAAATAEALRDLQGRFPEPRALARELIQRGWLTAYQINQLFQGKGNELVFGSYVLLERLGEGASGQVFKARHQKLGRVVALKILRKARLSHYHSQARFRREIEAVARLSHPNIVLAFDADEADGRPFFTMEFVEGIDLLRLVRQDGPLPVWQACDYIRQAALGLRQAGERGMVHRDVKPSNLMVTTLTVPGKDGAAPFEVPVVKLLDLGLARLTDPAGTGNLTHVQTILGTPDYMAPEQARDSRAADIRSDLYSLGCTFYFALTGEVPFPAESSLEKLMKHALEEPVPVEKRRPEVPPAVAAVVRRMLAKSPEDRYQSPGELAEALTRLLPAGTPILPPDFSPPAPPAASPGRTVRRRRVVPAWVWAAVGTALLFGGLALLLKSIHEPPPAKTTTGRRANEDTALWPDGVPPILAPRHTSP
jgi:eukaryotic-like serine/threonine-protein kinase